METTNSKTAPIVQEKDQNQVTLDLMRRMRLTGMANAFEESLTSTYAEAMTPDGFISWLVAREWDYRSSAAIDRLIRGASFRYNAYPEETDYSISRGLNQNQTERLPSPDFARQGQNLFITGYAGTCKSLPATAIGYHACKNGIRTLYSNTSKQPRFPEGGKSQEHHRDGTEEDREVSAAHPRRCLPCTAGCQGTPHPAGNHRRPP